MTPSQLRALFEDETMAVVRLTSSAPPAISEIHQTKGSNGRTYYDVETWEDPPDQIGQNLSGPLVSLIGGVIGVHDSSQCAECQANPLLAEQTTHYSYKRWPVRKAMLDLDRMCRRRHHSGPRWFDHAQGPLCSMMLKDAIEGGCSILWCAHRYRVPYARAERLIAAGLRFIGDALERAQEAQLGIVHDRDRCDVCREEGA